MSDDRTIVQALDHAPRWHRKQAAAAHSPADTIPPPLQITRPGDLGGITVPERRWIMPDWLPVGHTTGLYGDGGTGKSLLSQQLMTHAAVGRPFLGIDVEHVRSFGVVCEDDEEELRRRQTAINASLGVAFNDLDAMQWVSRVGSDNLLMTFDGGVGQLTPFWHQVHEAATSFGARLVVLDTAADLFGGNENDRGQVRQFVQGACTRLAQKIDGAVLLCAHPSRSGMSTGTGDSGSTGWNAAFRSRLFFQRLDATADDPEPDPDIRKLSRKKANYASANAEIEVRYQTGAFVVEGGSAEHWIDRTQRENRADEIFLKLLDQREHQSRRVSHKERAGNFAPKVFAKMRGAERLQRKDFEQAMERLFAAGEIEVAAVRDERRRNIEAIQRSRP